MRGKHLTMIYVNNVHSIELFSRFVTPKRGAFCKHMMTDTTYPHPLFRLTSSIKKWMRFWLKSQPLTKLIERYAVQASQQLTREYHIS